MEPQRSNVKEKFGAENEGMLDVSLMSKAGCVRFVFLSFKQN